MEYALKQIRLGEGKGQLGIKPALCFRGTTVAHAVINDETVVRSVTITLQAYDKAPPVLLKGEPYPVDRYIRHMHEIGTRKGITRRAAALLGGGQALPSDEGLPPDETATSGSVEPPEGPKEAPETPPEPPAALRKTATARRSAKAAPPEPPKAPKAAKTATNTAKPKPTAKLKPSSEKYGGRGNMVRDLAAELKTDPKALRIRLRAAGLKAPYNDITKMRKALK